jgi:DNA-binding transcriptional LysR family regulator
MEWQQLEYFRIVARTEHFTKAAEQLSISQPALSRAITNLETEVGVMLFDRIGRNVRLNSFGKVFLKHVDCALNEVQKGIAAVTQLNDPATGVIALGFLLSLGLNVLPDLIGKFNRQYPRVELHLYENVTVNILKQLVSGEVDLCLTSLFPPQPGIAWTPLFTEELYAYLPVNHPLAQRPSVRLAELATEPFIGFKKRYGMRTLMEQFCQAAGFTPFIKLEGGDVATIIGLVSSGLGVALIPKLVGIDSAKIKGLPISKPLCRREIGLAWLHERELPPSVALFREFLITQFTKSQSG